jgi:eukaryotic-like serine/threonine-protein kinase
MPLVIGESVGPYQVLAPIGVGGMGEVYRARDTKLDREVALKVLPEVFTADPERVARFQREAQLLASLNHPNIATIHGLEESNGVQALVLELVEGPTVADRIAHRPIPLDEALPIARQIAEALEAAHEKGVIHRDLKPANIKVTPDGAVKVLDFGLAKLLDSDAAAAGPPRAYSPAVTNSPTITTPAMTQMGVILGTAAYMSPEQAKGKPADKRSDIWAFGCVLYEMLTAKRAFDGEDVSDTLAAVLRAEPNWAALPADMPVAIRTLIQGSLKKDARQRIGDVSTILFLLENHATLSPAAAGGPSPATRVRRAVAAAVALAAIGALGIIAGRSMRPSVSAPPTVTRFAFTLPDDQRFTQNGNHIIAISPDGTRLAYVANRRLFLRSLSELESRPIAGTEVAEGLISAPVFSPDGQSIAYWVGIQPEGGTLKRIPVTGGAATTLCGIAFPSGMTWSADGILVGLRNNTIVRVAANGGQPELLVTVKDGQLWGPQMLPGGDAVLFSVAKIGGILGVFPTDWDKARVVVRSLKTGEERTVIDGGSDARYLRTGHIIYFSGSTLFAMPFDSDRRAVTGRAVPMVADVFRARSELRTAGAVYAGISESGTLAYISGSTSVKTDVAFIERMGQVTPLKLQSGLYQVPRVSPDGQHFAVERIDNEETHIWIGDLTSAPSLQQLTLGGKQNAFPVWSPDGQRIAFQSDREGDTAIFQQRSDGTGTVERLTKPDERTTHVPHAWSRDGGTLLFSETHVDGTFALKALSVKDRTVTPFGGVQSVRYSPAAVFSPDGRWVAYTLGATEGNVGSNAQVFVQPFPATGAHYPVARGIHPLWSPDGGVLFYHRLPDTADHMEMVTVTSRSGQVNFTFSNPVSLPLREMRYSPPGGERNWDAMPDGKRFLGILPVSDAGAGRGQINVVINWIEELKQQVPPK